MRKVKLGELGTFRNGLNFSKSDYTPNGVKFIGVGDFKNRTKPDYTHLNTVDSAIASFDDLLIDGDILFVRSNGNKNLVGRTLHISNLTEKTTYSGFCIRFRPNTLLVDSTFLFWMLRSPECIKQFTYSQQTNISNLSQSKLAQVELSLPSLSTQHLISSLLSTIDSKIETNGKIIAELESLARIIYDYWFTQFDFPDENGNPYRSSGGKMVHNNTLHRDIPEGWEVKPLGDLLTWERGISYTSKNLGEGVPMINLASFSPTGYSQGGLKQYKGHYPESKVLHPYDLVMCNTQQTSIDFSKDIIGHAFLVPDVFDGDIVFSHHVTHITVDETLKYWLTALFDSDYFHRYIVGYVSGTSIMGLDFSGVEKFNSPIPPISLLKQYKSFMKPVYQRKSSLLKESAKLTALRDWLLPLLMNGQAIIEQ